MILRAVRLRNVRKFGASGVALEAISPGLNVISQDNEFGKSTVFEALRTALFYPHTSTHREVRALEPWIGGTPHIEIDMDLGGQALRLVRRFGRAGGLTELRDLDTGREIARAGEADERLRAALGADKPGQGPTGLLWVEQGQSMSQPEGGPAGTALLSELLSREVGALTGGERAQAYLDRTRERLGEMRTDKTGRPRGDYKAALDARDELEATLAELSVRAGRTEAARAELAETERKLADMTGRDGAELRGRIEAAQAALADAKGLQARVDAARRETANLASLVEAARREARAEDERLERLASLAARREALEAERAASEASRGTHSDMLDDADKALAEARDRMREATLTAQAARRWASAREARERIEELERRVEAGQEARDDLAALDARLEPMEMGSRELERLEGLSREVESGEAALAATQTSLRFEGEGEVMLDGAPIGRGERRLDGPARVELPGLGVLHVTPPATANDAALREARARLDAELTAAGVADIEEARERVRTRDSLERERAQLAFQLGQIAPKGLDALGAELAELRTRAGEADDPGVSVAEADADLDGASVAHAEAQGAQAAARAARDAAHAALELARTRLSDLDAEVARLSGPGRAAELADTLAVREAAHLDANAALAALLDTLPDLDALEADLARLTQSRDNRERARTGLLGRRGELSQQLRASRAEGIGETVEAVRAQAARAGERVESMEAELRALTLLRDTLEGAQSELQAEFNAPVLSELQPLLAQVIPDASLQLGGDFRAEALMRGDRAEDLLQLSGGTQGQIAVLTRLAFAKIMGAQGRPSPVILDETFVHSDDQRLEAMFRALHMAARDGVQCIVMTCHSRMFETLGGHVLEPRDWPAATSADP